MYPDHIPPEIGWPVGILLWLILFAMILWDRHKLNKALRQRPTLKIMNEHGDWVKVEDETPERSVISRRPVSNFFDQDAQVPVTHRFETQVRTELPKPPKGRNE